MTEQRKKTCYILCQGRTEVIISDQSPRIDLEYHPAKNDAGGYVRVRGYWRSRVREFAKDQALEYLVSKGLIARETSYSDFCERFYFEEVALETDSGYGCCDVDVTLTKQGHN